jgi:hypothetical protein
MNKEVVKIIIKVLIYALGLIGSALGITALASCSVSHNVDGSGKQQLLQQTQLIFIIMVY